MGHLSALPTNRLQGLGSVELFVASWRRWIESHQTLFSRYPSQLAARPLMKLSGESALDFSRLCNFNVKQKASLWVFLVFLVFLSVSECFWGCGQGLTWFQLLFDVFEAYREIIFWPLSLSLRCQTPRSSAALQLCSMEKDEAQQVETDPGQDSFCPQTNTDSPERTHIFIHDFI